MNRKKTLNHDQTFIISINITGTALKWYVSIFSNYYIIGSSDVKDNNTTIAKKNDKVIYTYPMYWKLHKFDALDREKSS